MMVQANLSAGAFALNTPVFNLYRTNVCQHRGLDQRALPRP